MHRLLLISAALLTFAKGQEAVRWNASFNETYLSAADGIDVPFQVRTPPKIEGHAAYPMIVVLNGGPAVAPSERFPFFQIRPTRNRIWGYRAISTYDAIQSIAHMKANYPIDPDRVYLVGSSAGGSGAMHLASCFPDEFAAVLPLVAAGNNYPLVNFKNLPVAFHHGTSDWTSAICNARVQAQRMAELGCPVILKEYASGHSVPKRHEPLVEWLFAQKRDPSPLTISHQCEAPSLGRSYWIWIREFDDPHQAASIEVRVEAGTAVIQPKNVAAFSLDLETLPEEASQVEIGDDKFPLAAEFQFKDDAWKAEPIEKPAKRQYEAGAANNLYQGEPLMVVYGDGLLAAAEKLASYGGPTFTPMRYRFPIVAAADLTADQAAGNNLILLGTPEENAVTRALLPRLPIEISDGALHAGNRPPLPLEGQVLGLLHPHPDHPDRLIYLLAAFTDDGRFRKAPQMFLASPDGFNRVSQADLLVQNLDHHIGREMQFGKDWTWLDFPDSDKPLPEEFRGRTEIVKTHMKIMIRKSSADFALWWGPTDKGMWGTDLNTLKHYNPDFYTAADYRTRNSRFATTLGGISGADLKEIWNRWIQNQEMQVFPSLKPDELDDEKIYRVHIPMDLYINLGRRNKNLIDPAAGPQISPAEVMAEVFGTNP
ncbi:MAG: hypothetical protein ACI8UO_005407 [Verrucomicrobiales bacterium]|jgi:hypothetical protein